MYWAAEHVKLSRGGGILSTVDKTGGKDKGRHTHTQTDEEPSFVCPTRSPFSPELDNIVASASLVELSVELEEGAWEIRTLHDVSMETC